ncbi:MATE family efflux transporter [Colwellia sp. E2M01]|uniref:MATE family efflux transporter n=1 Tax=Colwellia sp. E2M01 TaxID=2841561 RepID=UPI0020901477|nr:MATE family efflux transporter [Colwellia sp. E2M01]
MFTIDFLKKTMKLAWPISLQSVLVTFLGMIDIIMVSHLGNEAVAAVGIGNRIFFVVLIMLTGIATGVGIMSAQYYGASQANKIKNTIVLAIIFAYLFLLPVIVLNFFYAAPIVNLATTDLAVIGFGESYLWITAPSLLFIAVILIFEGALRATGQVKLPMVFSVLAIVLNVILNYWLINGGLGIEPMGIVGAAWATTLARLFHVLILIYCLQKIAHPVFPNKECLSKIYDRQKWFNFIQLTWPLMLSFGVWSLGTFGYQLIYGRIGTVELAVMSMLTPIEGMLIAFFFGFSAACSIIVGQNLGKDNFQEAWKTGVMFSMGGPIITFALALIIYSFEGVIFKSFQAMETLTLQLAAEIFALIVFGTCLKVYNMTISIGILRAGGDNKYCLIIDTIGMWVVSLPLTFIAAFYFQWPLFYVVLTAYSEEMCKAVMFTWRMKKKVWLKNLTTD